MNPIIFKALLREYNNPASREYRSPLIARVITEEMQKRNKS